MNVHLFLVDSQSPRSHCLKTFEDVTPLICHLLKDWNLPRPSVVRIIMVGCDFFASRSVLLSCQSRCLLMHISLGIKVAWSRQRCSPPQNNPSKVVWHTELKPRGMVVNDSENQLPATIQPPGPNHVILDPCFEFRVINPVLHNL